MKKRKLWFFLAFIWCAFAMVFAMHCMRQSRPTRKFSGQVASSALPPISSDFALPLRLQKSGLEVLQIRTGGQLGVTCGSHAVVNARAIRLILESDGQLTNQAIRSNADVLDTFIQRPRLCNQDIYNLAKYIGLEYYLVFAYDNKAGKFYEVHHSDSFGSQLVCRMFFGLLKRVERGITILFLILAITGSLFQSLKNLECRLKFSIWIPSISNSKMTR